MMRTTVRFVLAAVALAFLLSTAGCGGSPTATVGPTASPVPRPDVTAAPGKVSAPAPSGYAGYALKLKPAHGQELIIKDSAAVQLVMDASATERLQVKDAVAKYSNKLTVLDADGKAKYTYALSSDGQMLLKSQDNRVFRMPEYVYYMLENSIWTYGSTLMDDDVKWQPDKGTATLELDLPRLIKTAMLPAFGYSLAYFTTYKIYGVNTATRGTAKVYVLATYAGYDVHGQSFAPNFFYTTPMTLIFAAAGGDSWKLVALKQPALTSAQPAASSGKPEETSTQPKESSAQPTETPQPNGRLKGQALYNSIRMIFPFDYMEAVTDDVNAKKNNTTIADMSKDIVRQATEYLNGMGIEGLTVDS
jgi:hypothetical protein